MIEVEIYCWRCGSHEQMLFTFDSSQYGHIGQSACPACGNKIYVPKEDLTELKDRQETRGIPR